MKKWLAWVLVLCLILSAPPPVLADGEDTGTAESSGESSGSGESGGSGESSGSGESGGSGDSGNAESDVEYLDSGFLDRPKMTPLEIQKLLDENPTDMPADDALYDTRPSFETPFYEGRVRAVLLQRAAGRLSALRNLAGLPDVTIDSTLCEKSQYGAVLLGTEGVPYSDEPSQPEGMDTAFYKVALDAVQSSNLCAGQSLLDAPLALMEDSDKENISLVGHRRWQLYPALKKIGFGYVSSAPNYYEKYTVENVFDYSGTLSDYHYISWPASGNFPSDLFSGNTAWSVTLNPKEYAVPDQVNVTVFIRRVEDRKSWLLTGNSTYTPSDSGAFLRVDKTGCGVANAIIFRPDGIDTYSGTYNVIIRGLTNRKKESVKFAFQVNFFDLATESEGITGVTVSRFTDTALSVSATSYVAQPGKYTLCAAAYDADGKIAAINARMVNLESTRKSYTLMLEPCINAVQVRCYLLDGKGRPVSLPRTKVVASAPKPQTDDS